MALILFIVIWWSVAYGTEQTKKQWREACDNRARQLRATHPDWSRARARRRAKVQTATWWAREVVAGFPTMRQTLAEDYYHVAHLRESAAITRESRLADVRSELQALRDARDEYQAAVKDGSTTLSFGSWYGQREREAAEKPVPAVAGTATPGTPSSPGPAGTAIPAPAPATGPGPATAPLVPSVPPARPEPGPTPLGPSGARLEGAAESPGPPGAPAGDPPRATGTKSDDEPTGPLAGPFPDQPDGGVVIPLPVPVNPGQPAEVSDLNPDNAGDDMSDIPSGELTGDSPYLAAQAALDGYERVAQENEQAAETLEAQLTMHGFDRDHALMDHVRGLREAAGQIRTHAAQARQSLTDHHAMGAEYHQSGTDANASAFRP
jgi:hypothetical protein